MAKPTGAPGSVLLWIHVAWFLLLAFMGNFARDTLFGAATAQHAASVAAIWLSSALILLAAFLATAARSGSAEKTRFALLLAFLFDFQAPIAMLRYPGMIHHFEADLGILPGLILIPLFLLVGATAYELSRVRRLSRAG